jgi:anti-anti-sigma factor
MKSDLSNGKLTIYLEGEINSYNAEDVEEEIDSLVSKGNFNSIELDFEKVNYVSSAGLRIVVKLKQQFDQTSLVKVPSVVNDIFEMVGLPTIIKIERL